MCRSLAPCVRRRFHAPADPPDLSHTPLLCRPRAQAVAAGVDATNARLVALAGAVGDLERRLEQEAAESSAEADALKETLRHVRGSGRQSDAPSQMKSNTCELTP